MNEFLKEQEERNYWLQRGVQAERERIIKLLEVALDYSEIDCALFWEEEIEISKGRGTQVTKDELIALIKGGQK